MRREVTVRGVGRFSCLITFAVAFASIAGLAIEGRGDEPRPLDDLKLEPASAAPEMTATTNLVGKCVVPRFGKFALRDDHGTVVKDGTEFQVYRVERVDGDRLRLHAMRSTVSGWSAAEQVVVVDEPRQPAPAAPPSASPALRAWAQMPDQLVSLRDEDEDTRNAWENGAGLGPRDVAESFKKMFNGKSGLDYKLMIAEFDEAIRADPRSASTYYFRGVARKQQKEYDKAIADFSEAIRINPRDAQAYCSRGLAWAEKKRYDKAISDFSEAIQIDGLRADAHYFRGYAQLLRKKYDESVADLTEVIRLAPRSAMVYGVRGWAWEKKGDIERAIADYTESLRYDSQNSGTYVQRGAAWGSKKAYDKAIADFDEAARLDPENAEAHYLLGMCWCAKDQLDKGLEELDRAIALDPKLTGVYATRGRIWYAKKEYAKAASNFDQAIRRQPQLAVLYLGRAEAWQRQKVYDKALTDYREAIDIEPKNALFLNNLAWLLAVCPEVGYRNGKKAVETSTKACELTEWKEPGYIDTLAAAYAEAGDFSAAMKWQAKAIALIKDAKEKADYQPRLDLYKAKKPYHDAKP
jgi:tetratricopeptide (TPR) repeat protein